MKRSADTTESLVYAYGCGQPEDGLGHAEAEMDRCRALWDALVAIEEAAERETLATARRQSREVETALAQVEAAEIEIAVVRRAGGKVEPELWARLKAARGELWPHLKTWSVAHPEEVKRIELARRAQVVIERRRTTAWWGNYNRVLADYDRSRIMVRRMGRKLRKSDPRRDDGCLTVQIQRTHSGLGAAPEELQSGAVSAVQIGRVPDAAYDPATFRGERGRLCRTEAEVRVDAAGNMLRLPLHLHRPLPEGARIKSVQLTWRSVGGRRRYQLACTVTRPRVAIQHPGSESVRVDCPVEAAHGALIVARTSDGAVLELDRDWVRGMDRVRDLHRIIDSGLVEIARWIVASEAPAQYHAPIARWSEGRRASVIDDVTLHDMVRLHRPQGPLRDWYLAYRRHTQERDGLRQRLLGRRREIYRLWARALAVQYRMITLEDRDYAAIAMADRGEEGGKVRQMAAPHLLVLELRHQARKHGAELALVAAEAPASAKVTRKTRAKKINALPATTTTGNRTARNAPDNPLIGGAE